MPKKRIDMLLVEKGLFASREQARAALIAGDVQVNGFVADKPGHLVDETAEIVVASKRRYVSRGGEKLAGALEDFALNVEDMRAIDVGASTGGFSDCLLQRGVRCVVSLDVGYGQLAWSLRNDPRVTVLERTNIRDVEPQALGGPFDLVVCDVSFISLKTVMPHLASLLARDGDLLALVKPQFEAGKGRVGKKGVVRDPSVHEEVLMSAVEYAHGEHLVVRGLAFSPITGPQGNIEFWLWASFHGPETDVQPREVVSEAHMSLGG